MQHRMYEKVARDQVHMSGVPQPPEDQEVAGKAVQEHGERRRRALAYRFGSGPSHRTTVCIVMP